jgi:hypothetical protein
MRPDARLYECVGRFFVVKVVGGQNGRHDLLRYVSNVAVLIGYVKYHIA